ncbi:MAG: polyprenyl synthetase family protein [Verrucomicrobia bacterium]|nr:polyprenyl synthetase family protein [Verrucomicrobiota bacterium]MBU6445778.1 polyprenyl synthetase family protein [Verrucomicrobiota bacterium]MDE3046815.1 polyprenyl synthetase family protein [Verrucomicrobiota bacterium]
MIEKIEQRLRELIPARDETIFEAARYSLLSKGKRLRPLLTLATAAAFGVDPLTALDPACALEMIHAYSLIHDDLPCMDNDDLRRGQPTLHKVYGEAMALLAGDYLLTFAFEVIANANLGREQRLQIVKTVAMRCGAPGMIGGQVMDIEQTGKEIEEETLMLMHEGKTAALFTACLECGSLVAGYPPTPLLQTIGREFGLAYQFQNDLQDVSATAGKKAGGDAANHKQTAVTLFGVDGVKERVRSIKKSIDEKFMGLPNQGGPLAALMQQILT